jgi:biopolymer transport protein ExbB/TolQ
MTLKSSIVMVVVVVIVVVVVMVVVVVIVVMVVIMVMVDVKELVWMLVMETWDRNEEGVHVAEVGDKVVVEEVQPINQLSGMGSGAGSTKERVDVGVGLPPKIVWKK